MTTKMNNNNNQSIQVDPKWVGLVIGKGGNTLRTLEQQVGGRCRIAHDRNKRNTGTFHIRASSKAYLVKAEEAIHHLIQQQRPRPRRVKQNPILSVSTTQRKKVTLRTNFGFQDSIRNRKREKWLKHHATEEEKAQHLARSHTHHQHQEPRPTLNFPRLGKGQQKELVGVWVGNLDDVKQEKAMTPTQSQESSLSILKKQHSTENKEIEFRPLPKSNLLVESRGRDEEQDAFSEDDWEVQELGHDDEEWSDGELEYGNFDDEEDLAFTD
jgi:hypothetical protein